jgi:hypothetical protein
MDAKLAQQLVKAADELYDAIRTALQDERGVHLETALTAAGYLAGAALLRDAGVDLDKLTPGSYVIVDGVNEEGPKLLELTFDMIHQAGVANAPPVDPVPPDHAPRRDYAGLMQTLQPIFFEIVERHRLPEGAHPYVAARAAAQMILAGQNHLDPRISKAVLTQAMVQGAKTVPPKVD